jgi:hypothetical protein
VVRLTDTTTRVVIVRLEPVQSGSNRRSGQAWTKYAVEATTPDGRPLPVDKPVFTFDALQPGEQDVLIEPYEDRATRNVVSYTMKRPKTKKSGGDNGDAVSRKEFDRLTARVKALEELYESIPTGATRP